jgi:hypothetical protein
VRYLPGVAVQHRMDPRRLTPAWFLRRARAQGVSKAMIEWSEVGAGRRLRLLLKRSAIAGLSGMAWGLASAAGQPGLALVARCKLQMSLAYLGAARPLWQTADAAAAGEQP